MVCRKRERERQADRQTDRQTDREKGDGGKGRDRQADLQTNGKLTKCTRVVAYADFDGNG